MDDELDPVFEQIAEAIRGLQAGQIAQARMVRALISSHPDPDALRAAWHHYAAPSAADAATAKVLDPKRAQMHEAVSEAIQAWNDRLDADLRKT